MFKRNNRKQKMGLYEFMQKHPNSILKTEDGNFYMISGPNSRTLKGNRILFNIMNGEIVELDCNNFDCLFKVHLINGLKVVAIYKNLKINKKLIVLKRSKK